MSHTCRRCSRLNPPEASFCFFDGTALDAQAANGSATAQRFLRPLSFPSGRTCGNFDELALACQQSWQEARQLLEQGTLESFLGSLGRADLALAAREAAESADRDGALDQFLSRLPTPVLEPPRLAAEPSELRLGPLKVGEDHRFEFRLKNLGMRLLHGTLFCDCPWLGLGEGPGTPQKLFRFKHELVVPVQVLGRHLRAGARPMEARIIIDSNGGTAIIRVSADVPVKPFPEGLLAGAVTPRQVAEKAMAAPKEAAAYLESGAVARWYEENGWQYPIRGPVASDLAAVQQFFEALGLSPPPRVEVTEQAVSLQGNVGDQLRHVLRVRSEERRPVYAHGVSDQPWLEVGPPRLKGRTAKLPLTVPSVPDRRGEALQANVTITANGNQRLVVPVTLVVGPNPASAKSPPGPAAKAPTPPAPAAAGQNRRPADSARPAGLRRKAPLLPAGVLVLLLLGVAARDVFVGAISPRRDQPADGGTQIALRFHDHPNGDALDKLVPPPTMRFGLVMVGANDSKGQPRRLTADPLGRTNNVCVRLDGEDRLFGSPPGHWQRPEGIGEATPAGGQGLATWVWDDRKVRVTQRVEIVPGEQTGVQDTCLVRYEIDNQDTRPHAVGLRFLLDTYIGANDGVPFTIPGESRLCADRAEFATPEKVPDFIEALENEDLAHPGTVAHLKLKLGKEPPSRVTLGAWPDEALQHLLPDLRDGSARAALQGHPAQGAATRWDVPLVPMKTLWPYDSAVVIYWDPKPLAPGAKREVGFAYGLGSVSSSGKLLLTVDGSFKPGGELTVTALVRGPSPGETLTLSAPSGFAVAGEAVQKLPDVPPEAAARTRAVTWKVKAGPVGKYEITVQSSTGAVQKKPVTIKAASIFD